MASRATLIEHQAVERLRSQLVAFESFIDDSLRSFVSAANE